MKYVMFEWPSLDGQSFTHVPVIFPEMLNHDDMAKAFEYAVHEQRMKAQRGRGSPLEEQRARLGIRPRAVSAGFLEFAGGGVVVDMSRGSETLKMMPHEADQLRINTWRYTYGQF